MLRRKFLSTRSNRYSSAVETVIEIEDDTPDTDCDSNPGIDPKELDRRTIRSSSSFSSSSSSSSDSEIDLNQLDNITRTTPTTNEESGDDSEEICFKCLDLRTLPRSKGSRKDVKVLKCEKHRQNAQPLLPPSKVKRREVVMLPLSLTKRGSSEKDYETDDYSGRNSNNERHEKNCSFFARYINKY